MDRSLLFVLVGLILNVSVKTATELTCSFICTEGFTMKPGDCRRRAPALLFRKGVTSIFCNNCWLLTLSTITLRPASALTYPRRLEWRSHIFDVQPPPWASWALHPITYKPLLYFFGSFLSKQRGGWERHIHGVDASHRTQSHAGGGERVVPEAGVLTAKLSLCTLLLFSG